MASKKRQQKLPIPTETSEVKEAYVIRHGIALPDIPARQLGDCDHRDGFVPSGTEPDDPNVCIACGISYDEVNSTTPEG